METLTTDIFKTQIDKLNFEEGADSGRSESAVRPHHRGSACQITNVNQQQYRPTISTNNNINQQHRPTTNKHTQKKPIIDNAFSQLALFLEAGEIRKKIGNYIFPSFDFRSPFPTLLFPPSRSSFALSCVALPCFYRH